MLCDQCALRQMPWGGADLHLTGQCRGGLGPQAQQGFHWIQRKRFQQQCIGMQQVGDTRCRCVPDLKPDYFGRCTANDCQTAEVIVRSFALRRWNTAAPCADFRAQRRVAGSRTAWVRSSRVRRSFSMSRISLIGILPSRTATVQRKGSGTTHFSPARSAECSLSAYEASSDA
jgi:hypothetical protein